MVSNGIHSGSTLQEAETNTTRRGIVKQSFQRFVSSLKSQFNPRWASKFIDSSPVDFIFTTSCATMSFAFEMYIVTIVTGLISVSILGIGCYVVATNKA